MKLYAGVAPNAFRVLAFMEEKNIEIPIEKLDVMKGETRLESHLKRNSLGEIPVLELDDGSFLSESVAICRYLESAFPQPPLLGENPAESAAIEMWNRRMEQKIMGPYAQWGLHTIPIFADKLEQLPEYAETQRRLVPKNWAWLETELADGREFVCGNRFTIADITGMTGLMIDTFLQGEIPENLHHVPRWISAVKSRESWKHSVIPGV